MKLNCTDTFKYLGTPFTHNRQSWCEYSEELNRLTLRVWTKDIISKKDTGTGFQQVIVQKYEDWDYDSGRYGFRRRNEHLELLKQENDIEVLLVFVYALYDSEGMHKGIDSSYEISSVFLTDNVIHEYEQELRMNLINKKLLREVKPT